MVGVSDDVNEYAMALRNTEDKLRRCPTRVRPGRGGSLEGGQVQAACPLGFPRTVPGETWPSLALLLG